MTNDKPKADLSSLRINRDIDNESGSDGGKKIFGRILVWCIIIVVLLGAGFLLFGSLFKTAIEVQLASATYVSPSQAQGVLTASGYVVAQRKAAVASKATGRLLYLGVVEGDTVREGEIIARIEDADVRAVLEQMQASLRLNEAELNDAGQTLERQKALLERGLISQAEFDAAEARYNRVVASIDVARASVVAAEVALENTLIRAPFNGTVLSKNADVGEMVAPMAASMGARSAVVTIADMTSLEVEADVSESNIQRITPNQPCEITLDAYPETRYQGYVTKIVPTADRAKATVLVKVGFRVYDSKVLPEMSAKVLFLSGERESGDEPVTPVLSIPGSALAEREGRTVVFMVEGNRAVERAVVTGRRIGTMVEIREGISPGERVIARVDERIHAGVNVVVK